MLGGPFAGRVSTGLTAARSNWRLYAERASRRRGCCTGRARLRPGGGI